MKRQELEHLIRAAAAITNEYELVIIGSQSILGALPNAPSTLLKSMEADIYPLRHPELADLIDGAIGELSPFEERFGYYAQGVGPETAILPAGWEQRLIKVQNENTDLKIGLCLDPDDLAASKLAAGRDKDKDFVAAMLELGVVTSKSVQERIELLPVEPGRKDALVRWVTAREPEQQPIEPEPDYDLDDGMVDDFDLGR